MGHQAERFNVAGDHVHHHLRDERIRIRCYARRCDAKVLTRASTAAVARSRAQLQLHEPLRR